MRTVIHSKRPEHRGVWTLFTGALFLTLAACGSAGAGGASVPPPPGWTDITPPDSGQMANYAVSPDIPGLILATISGRAQASADPLAAARLWRSTDGGASWQSLDSLSVNSGAQLYMPPGGHGLVFAQNLSDASIQVSADDGTTWRKLPSATTPDSSLTSEWKWLAGSVAIGKRLYAGGFEPGFGSVSAGTQRFSVSDDHGITWRPVEAGADPAGSDAITLALTSLDASGSSWLRLVVGGSGGAAPYSYMAFERSSDDGVTWSIISRSLPAQGQFLRDARFATSASHPARVCAALSLYDNTPNVITPPTVTLLPTAIPYPTTAATGAFSMPPPQQQDVSLLASDDGGATWHGGAVLALRRAYGGAVSPGVAMSADGSCYLATAQKDGLVGRPEGQVANLWRLAPGATQPTSVFTIIDRTLQSLALAPSGAGGGERLVALTRISGPGDGEAISCGAGCATVRDGGIYRLIWQPLPAA